MQIEHPIEQQIIHLHISCDEGGNPMDYIVGMNCSRIEACQKSGMYANIPYIRVYEGDVCLLEACQHNVGYIRFTKEAAEKVCGGVT